MRLGVRSRLFAFAFGLIALTIGVAYLVLRNELERLLLDEIRGDLDVRTALVALEADSVDIANDDLAAWDALADRIGRKAKARVTLIRRDGVVVGDSEVPRDRLPKMENHRLGNVRREGVHRVRKGRKFVFHMGFLSAGGPQPISTKYVENSRSYCGKA